MRTFAPAIARLPRPLLIAMAWTLIAIAAAGLVAVRLVAIGRMDRFVPESLADLAIIPLWALATPWIFRSAERWPASSRRNIALHAAFGAAFVVVSNIVIRLPLLIHGLTPFARNLAVGLAFYSVPAMLAYAAIVAIGHRIAPPREVPARPSSITIRDRARVVVVPLDEIQWIQAEDNYVLVHTASRSYTAREKIGQIEKQIDGAGFLRVHRSAIVRRDAVQEVRPLTHGDFEVILTNGAVVRGSRSRRAALAMFAGAST
jgi:two-component system LytT family response regulator